VKIRFTPQARAGFLGALDYIRRDDPAAARRFRKKAEKAIRRLARYPDSGRRLPEFPDLPFREVIVSPYRFFYRKERGAVWIVAVWHGAQQPREP
jgi:plasmid stabilization system protein ParE